MKNLLRALALTALCALAAPALAQSSTPSQTYAWHAFQIYRDWTLIRDMSVDVTVTENSVVDTDGSIQFEHRNLVVGPVGFITRISVRKADASGNFPPLPGTYAPVPTYQPGTWVKGVKAGGNIASIEDHYGTSILRGRFRLTPGKYRIEVWAVAHSSAAPNSDGLVQVYIPSSSPEADPYNQLIVDVRAE